MTEQEKERPYVQQSFSGEGEDMFLRKMFSGKPTGFYVDVGAHHPIRFSNTYLLYKLGWRGINIDPTPGVKEEFDVERPHDLNLDEFISDVEGEPVSFHLFKEPALNTGSGAIKDSYPNLYSHSFEKRSARLATVLGKNLPPGQDIDLLNVDAEGFDLRVLQSNDWALYRPKIVMVEAFLLPSSLRHSPIVTLLDEVGYDLRAFFFSTAAFIPKGASVFSV